jgi:hypothetical protein
MGALFRGKLLAALDTAIARGEITMPGGAAADPEAWDILRDRLHRMRWNVYAKRPFGGAAQVIRYLGRYTHRVGISNQRLVSMDEEGVTFRTKSGKTVTLASEAFLRRFLMHVLPSGFVKIRHYGLMASSHATTRLARARALLTATETPRMTEGTPVTELRSAPSLEVSALLAGVDLGRCPVCGANALVRLPLPLPEPRAPPVTAGADGPRCSRYSRPARSRRKGAICPASGGLCVSRGVDGSTRPRRACTRARGPRCKDTPNTASLRPTSRATWSGMPTGHLRHRAR